VGAPAPRDAALREILRGKHPFKHPCCSTDPGRCGHEHAHGVWRGRPDV